MAGYSTYGILNNGDLTPAQKMEMLREQNKVGNNVSMLNLANKSNWDTMLGYALGKYAGNYVNRGIERRAQEKDDLIRKLGIDPNDPNAPKTLKEMRAMDDLQNTIDKANEGWENGESIEDILSRRHGQGQTSEALTLNPNDGTIGLERSSTFNTGLLGGVNNPAINAQFQNDLMGKNILDSMNGQAAVPEVGVINGAVNPADMANGAEAASAGGGVNLLPSILGAAKSGNVDQAAGQIAGQYAKDALGIGAANPWLLGAKLLFGL